MLRTALLTTIVLALPAGALAQATPMVVVPPPPPASFVPPPTAFVPVSPDPTLVFTTPPQASRPRSHRRQRQRWEVIAPGILALAGGYVGWIVGSIAWNGVNNDCGGSSWLFPSCRFNGTGPDGGDIVRSFIPLVGPFWSAADSATMRGWDLAAPIFAGLSQVAGIVLIVVGVAAPVSRDVQLGVRGAPGGAQGTLTLRFGT